MTTPYSSAQISSSGTADIEPVTESDDSASLLADSLLRSDSTANDSSAHRRRNNRDSALASDSTKKSRFVKSKVDLDNAVVFSTSDSLVIFGKKNAKMFGNSDVKYGSGINLTAERISMDMNTNEVFAEGATDSVGEPKGMPVFKDKSGEYEAKTIKYNFKSQKGYITDIVTQQGEGYLTGGLTKKLADGEFYTQDGKYTTCSDHEHPHFYMKITKGKVKPKSSIVTGPAYMVLCDVPLPLAVPFGYFPFTSKYSSGVIFPTFGEDYNRGFYLRNGGYYLALSDNMDLALTGELYTRGSWGVNAQSTYVKRYRYSGNFNLNYLTTITGDKGSADYSKGTNFRVAWTHSQDAKANPNLNFSASVNFATSGYTRNDLNSYYNAAQFTENTKSSSVNITYKFPNSKWSLSTNANVSQRTADSTISVSFPNLTLTMSQVAPFKRKRAVGSERWYEKIRLSYNGQFQNSLTAKQNDFLKKSFVKDWRNGMKHSVPVSATFNMLKYFNITPSISLNDRMYSSKISRDWDPVANTVVCDTTYGFYNIFDFSTSVSMDTKIYGFFKPMKFLGDKVQMIRHVLTPTVSLSAMPDFSTPGWGYYGTYDMVDAQGVVKPMKYSYFQHGLYGTASQGKSGAISFSLANNLEMKVKSDKDSTGVKKVSLIENLTLSQSYNFAADSLRWSNINSSILLRLPKNFNLNLSAMWDPYTYQLTSSGTPVRVNRTRLQAGKGFAKLMSTGTSFSYTFNNDTFRKKDKKDKNKKDDERNPEAEQSSIADRRRNNQHDNDKPADQELDSDGYAKWDFPWSLSVNYSVNYSYGKFNVNKMDYDGKFTQNLSFSGNVRPTKNWSLNFSSSYNFDSHKISYMNCSISRDLHCFTMSASFVPVGPYKSYNFHIAVKSSLLSDLKYDKRSSTTNGIDWY